ncbi:MAG: hypothetical protein Q4B63_04280 [Clostridium perfringens]|nr:hypothetical protein [Clostridium perfringens]
MIKDKEYESLGENIFPIEYLSNEEKEELGVLEKRCCKSGGGGCKGCSKGQGLSGCKESCNSSRLSTNKEKEKCGGCKGCGCSK